METLAPGDLVVLMDDPGLSYPNAQPGAIGSVIGDADKRKGCPCGARSLLINYGEHIEATCILALKKIKPDGRQVTQWADCEWQPKKEMA